MNGYVHKQVGWYEYEPDTWPSQPPQPLTVYAAEPVATGLLDEDGNRIMRVPERLGFIR